MNDNNDQIFQLLTPLQRHVESERLISSLALACGGWGGGGWRGAKRDTILMLLIVCLIHCV